MKTTYVAFAFFLTATSISQVAAAELHNPGQKLYTESTLGVFNLNVHKVVIRLPKLTDETVRDEGAKKGFKLFGRVHEFCFFQNENDPIAETCLKDVGYRVRGNTSRGRQKRQFHIDFTKAENLFDGNLTPWTPANPELAKQKRFYGLKRINLRSGGPSSNDLSLAREVLASRIFERIVSGPHRSGPVYRLAYTKVYFLYCDDPTQPTASCSNPDYKGLYYLAENLDEDLIASRFDVIDAGALYSTAYAKEEKKATFRLEDFSHTAYDNEFFEIEKAAMPKKDAGGDLDEEWDFCKNLAQAQPALFSSKAEPTKKDLAPSLYICTHLKHLEAIASEKNAAEKLSRMFDLGNLLSYMVAANFTGHWDSLVGNANNDYLFFNPTLESSYGGKYQVVVWDLDLTFGLMNEPQTLAPATNFKKGPSNLLFELVLQNPELRQAYVDLYREKLAELSPAVIEKDLAQIEATVLRSVDGTFEDDGSVDYKAEFARLRSYLRDRYEAAEQSLKPLSR